MSSDEVEAPLPPQSDVIMPAKSEDKLEIEREEKERAEEEEKQKETEEKEKEKEGEEEAAEEAKKPEATEKEAENKKEKFKLKAPKFLRSRSKSRDAAKVGGNWMESALKRGCFLGIRHILCSSLADAVSHK